MLVIKKVVGFFITTKMLSFLDLSIIKYCNTKFAKNIFVLCKFVKFFSVSNAYHALTDKEKSAGNFLVINSKNTADFYLFKHCWFFCFYSV